MELTAFIQRRWRRVQNALFRQDEVQSAVDAIKALRERCSDISQEQFDEMRSRRALWEL